MGIHKFNDTLLFFQKVFVKDKLVLKSKIEMAASAKRRALAPSEQEFVVICRLPEFSMVQVAGYTAQPAIAVKGHVLWNSYGGLNF